MAQVILFKLLISFFLFGTGQKEKLRLEEILKNSPHDSIKVKLHNELAWQLQHSHSFEAMQNAREALRISRKLNNSKEEATSLGRIGNLERLQGNYRSAIDRFNEALTIERKDNHRYGIARALGQLCILHKNIGEYSLSEKYGKEALGIYLDLDTLGPIIRSYHRLAQIFEKQGKIQMANKMLDENVKLDLDSAAKANHYSVRAKLYIRTGDIASALYYDSLALELWKGLNQHLKMVNIKLDMANLFIELNELDKAEELIKACLRVKDSLGYHERKYDNYNSLGMIAEGRDNFEEAKKFYKRSIDIKKKAGLKMGLAIGYHNLGNIYRRLNIMDSALICYQLALDYNPESILVKLELNWKLSELFRSLREFEKAEKYVIEYGILKDSLKEIDKINRRVQDDFRIAKARSEELAEINRYREVKLAKQRQFITFLLLSIFLFIFLSFFIFRYFQAKKNKIIAEKNIKIQQDEIDKLIRNNELNEMGAMMEGQEKERKRIAQDLHDRLGSMLSMVKVHFKSVEENIVELQKQNKDQYEKANVLLDEACNEVRKIAHDMVSGVLSKFGLISALESLSKSINDTGQLKLNILDFGFENNRLNPDIEITLYRIIQELLSNTLKHAAASEMTIQLIRKDNNLNVLVEDDGIGFNPDATPVDGMGLGNIYARVNKMNGKVIFDSGKGSGTTVNIDIPIN